MVQLEELKKPSWVEATSAQVFHYLRERRWPDVGVISKEEDPPIVLFGRDEWASLECGKEIWELIPKGEVYENEHSLFTKDERFIWKNYGKVE